MTVTERILRDIHGVLLPGFNGTQPPAWVVRATEHGLAGVLLFGHNTPSPHEAAQVCERLRELRDDLLISSDEEGGDVSRVQVQGGSTHPGACALGQADDVDLTYRVAKAQGDLMRAVGVDLPITPSLDVASEPANPVIGVRSFGEDSDLVARHGAATIKGLQDAGVLTSAKHFPGHGDTDVDSHHALPLLDISREVLEQRELPPFARAISAGVDSIMTGHLLVPAIGPKPASQEPKVGELLRQMGLAGPIITDALDMAALHDREDSGPSLTDPTLIGIAGVRALLGGATMLCLGSTPGRDDEALFDAVVAELVRAVNDGELDPAVIARAAQINRDFAATARSRAAGTPPTLDEALAALEAAGTEAAAAAVSHQGDVHLQAGDALVDLRQGINLAAGARVRAILDLLTGEVGLSLVEPDDLPTWLSQNPGKRVAVLTKNVRDDVTTVLAQAPDAVVIHLGVPGAAPEAPNRVLGHGAGLVNSSEIVARCMA